MPGFDRLPDLFQSRDRRSFGSAGSLADRSRFRRSLRRNRRFRPLRWCCRLGRRLCRGRDVRVFGGGFSRCRSRRRSRCLRRSLRLTRSRNRSRRSDPSRWRTPLAEVCRRGDRRLRRRRFPSPGLGWGRGRVGCRNGGSGWSWYRCRRRRGRRHLSWSTGLPDGKNAGKEGSRLIVVDPDRFQSNDPYAAPGLAVQPLEARNKTLRQACQKDDHIGRSWACQGARHQAHKPVTGRGERRKNDGASTVVVEIDQNTGRRITAPYRARQRYPRLVTEVFQVVPQPAWELLTHIRPEGGDFDTFDSHGSTCSQREGSLVGHQLPVCPICLSNKRHIRLIRTIGAIRSPNSGVRRRAAHFRPPPSATSPTTSALRGNAVTFR